jgi:hypothetical protein
MISIVIFITIINHDWCLVLLLQSSQTILLFLLLNLLLLLYSMISRICVDLLLDFVITNHECIVTVLRFFRNVLILYERKLIRLRTVVRCRTSSTVKRAASLVPLLIAYTTNVR